MDWTLPPLWWLSPSPTLIKTLPLHCVRVFLFACFFHLDLAFIIFNYLLCKQNCLSTLISLHIKRFIRCFNTNFLICTKLLLHQSSKINMVQFIRAKLKAAAFTLCHYYSQLKRVQLWTAELVLLMYRGQRWQHSGGSPEPRWSEHCIWDKSTLTTGRHIPMLRPPCL